MRRAVLTLLLFLGLGGALRAQTQQGSWSNLNRLKAGQGIEVIESSLKRHGGKFVTVTDELLTLRENGSDVSVKREDVVRVSTSSGPKRGGHALMGLVAGGAIGAGIGAASGSKTGFLGAPRAEFAPLLASLLVPPVEQLSAPCSPPVQPSTALPLVQPRTEPSAGPRFHMSGNPTYRELGCRRPSQQHRIANMAARH
jgi:hypothetical protein